MSIREQASQFSAVILSQNLDIGSSLKVNFSKAGYEVFFIQDPEAALGHIQQAMPHVVFFHREFSKQPLNEFVQNVLKISQEIRLVPIAPDAEFETLSAYEPFGVSHILSSQAPYLEKRAVWLMDRICESLYLTYQNEDLLEDRKKKDSLVGLLQTEIESLKTQKQQVVQKIGAFRSVETLIQSYKTSESKEQVLNLFFDQLQGLQALYVKYLPSVRSFVATHAVGFPHEKIQGLSCQLQPPEATDLHSQVSLGVLPGSLSLMMKQEFSLTNMALFPLFVQGGLEGLVLTGHTAGSEEHHQLSDQFALFSFAYSHLSLEKKIEAVDLLDPVTEVYNVKHYRKRLTEEIARARRLKHPLSVVKIAIDDFEEIEQTLGSDVRDHVLRTISGLMVKSSRAHDFVARISMNELALVLVHCSRKGAGVRADRVRRIVETSSVLDHGVKLSVSVGISEFPTLCDSANDLDETSTQALMHIFQKGGNRICLFKAADEFQPEFEVSASDGEL